MKRDVRDYLLDLHRYAVVAARIVERRSLDDLAGDEIAVLALERAIEIMGEAASKLPNDIREKYPAVQWREIIGMRHRLAHADFGTDLVILYEVGTQRLPTLIPLLAAIVEREGAAE